MISGQDIDQFTESAVGELELAEGRLIQLIGRLPNARAMAASMRALATRLMSPVRVAVAGEFNTGKSSLCNRLIGIDTLPTAAIATTNIPTNIFYADEPIIRAVLADGARVPLADEATLNSRPTSIDVGLPLPDLHRVELIDLPGLADPKFQRTIEQLELQTPDAILWCSSCTQAWKETERQSWSFLPERLKRRTILVLTHADLVRMPNDRARLMTRVEAEMETVLSQVKLVSSKPRPGLNDPAERAAQDAQDGIRDLRDALSELHADIQLRRIDIALKFAKRGLSRVLRVAKA